MVRVNGLDRHIPAEDRGPFYSSLQGPRRYQQLRRLRRGGVAHLFYREMRQRVRWVLSFPFVFVFPSWFLRENCCAREDRSSTTIKKSASLHRVSNIWVDCLLGGSWNRVFVSTHRSAPFARMSRKVGGFRTPMRLKRRCGVGVDKFCFPEVTGNFHCRLATKYCSRILVWCPLKALGLMDLSLDKCGLSK